MPSTHHVEPLSKEIKGVPSSSMVKLKAILAESKLKINSGQQPFKLSSSNAIRKLNKGVQDRALKDDDSNTALKVFGNCPTRDQPDRMYQGNYKENELVDYERKAWLDNYGEKNFDEAHDSSRFDWLARPSNCYAYNDDDEWINQKRAEKRKMVLELANDTREGRKKFRDLQEKKDELRARRLALIQHKVHLNAKDNVASSKPSLPQSPIGTKTSDHLEKSDRERLLDGEVKDDQMDDELNHVDMSHDHEGTLIEQ